MEVPGQQRSTSSGRRYRPLCLCLMWDLSPEDLMPETHQAQFQRQTNPFCLGEWPKVTSLVSGKAPTGQTRGPGSAAVAAPHPAAHPGLLQVLGSLAPREPSRVVPAGMSIHRGQKASLPWRGGSPCDGTQDTRGPTVSSCPGHKCGSAVPERVALPARGCRGL